MNSRRPGEQGNQTWPNRRRLISLAAVVALLVVSPQAALAQRPAVTAPGDIVVVGDAIPAPLTTTQPDAARGRAILLDRAKGNCLICHRLPVATEPFQGTIGPDLSGIGRRLTTSQIRLRLVDQSRLNAATLMPPLYRTAQLVRVDAHYRDKTVLSAIEIEDSVAYLASLKD